jgi:hypothetical protein
MISCDDTNATTTLAPAQYGAVLVPAMAQSSTIPESETRTLLAPVHYGVAVVPAMAPSSPTPELKVTALLAPAQHGAAVVAVMASSLPTSKSRLPYGLLRSVSATEPSNVSRPTTLIEHGFLDPHTDRALALHHLRIRSTFLAYFTASDLYCPR